MPLVNVYFKGSVFGEQVQNAVPDLKKFLAEILSSREITLTSEEISIRFLNPFGGKMIASIELEVIAHAFPERIKKQDEICRYIMEFIQRKTGIKDIKVWLQLSELGHSW